MSRDPFVYIVIVNYKGAKDTIECLDSLSCLEGVDFRVIVVENGSPDDSRDRLLYYLGAAARSGWVLSPKRTGLRFEVKLHIAHTNCGFAGGCNIGIKEALIDDACSHVWLLNNDTSVEPESLRALLARFYSSEKIGICGSTLLYYHSDGVVQGCGGRFDVRLGRGRLLGALCRRSSLPQRDTVEFGMNYVIGASMLVSVDCIRAVGLLSERYFLYFEELDWAIRAKKLGYLLGWAEESFVHHKEGSAIGTSTRGRPSELAIFFMTASYLRLIMEHYSAYIIPAAIVSILRALKWAITGDLRLCIATFRGVRNFLCSPKSYKGVVR